MRAFDLSHLDFHFSVRSSRYAFRFSKPGDGPVEMERVDRVVLCAVAKLISKNRETGSGLVRALGR